MPGKIPRAFIDDLLNRIDIVDLIDARVPLKKKGREYWACCPFHNEKSASFSVSQIKQFYHCFGCQQHGNAISFLMDYDHMEFVEAIETLASSLSIEVPYEQGSAPAKKQVDDDLYATLQQCSNYYIEQLKQNETAIEYLKTRGISGDTAKDFAIGFAPPGWINLSGQRKNLVLSGMQIEKEDGNTYDRFRNRIMFPIRDRRGRCIAFGGRVIDPEDNPKYLNSPESPTFHKGEEIYGLYELKNAPGKIKQIFVTEGYMDVVALAEHGIHTTVATLGTAINNQQIEKLFRTSSHLIFCFDGDSAGRKAAWRALENCLTSLKEGRLAKFLFLPDNQDPDSFIKEFGQSEFINQAENSATLTDFLFNELLSRGEVHSLEGQSRFLDQLRPYYEKIPLQSLKNQILLETEKKLKVELDVRHLMMLGVKKHTVSGKIHIPQQHWTPTRLAINLLIQKPKLAQEIGSLNELIETDIPGIALLLQLLDIIHEEPDISTTNLLNRFTGHDNENHLYQLAAMQPAMDESHSIEQMFKDSIQQLHNQYISYRRKRLISLQQSGQKLSEEELLEYKKLFSSNTN